MENRNVLIINCRQEDITKVNEILGINCSSDSEFYSGHSWEYIVVDEEFDIIEIVEDKSDIIEEELDTPLTFISTFLDILEGKYDSLVSIGVKRSDISVWIYYGYDEQCNLEFAPREMKRLGDNGIVLCASCWESGNHRDS